MVIEGKNRLFHSGKRPGKFLFKIHAGEKYQLVRKFISGKSVLDVGCTGGDPEAYSSELWVHGFIKRHAKPVKGLDLNKAEVERLNGLGYDEIAYGNAEDFGLHRTSDVIFSGDLIEHLYNPGRFLIFAEDFFIVAKMKT
ncbi:MAG: hypothetical protein A4E48_02100 [Methanosaeta sp. PtaU1.Bin060]|nr:MAG: hypothetical protein A4E48_02100 [Methanosaeta sp. PtaU1.Bin060]